MTQEPVHKNFGASMSEWTEKFPNNLEFDEIGFWEITTTGQYGFGLSGDALVDYVRRCLLGLLKQGAFAIDGYDKLNWPPFRPDTLGIDRRLGDIP